MRKKVNEMKKFLKVLTEILYFLGHILLCYLYIEGNSISRILVVLVVLFIYSLIFFKTNSKISFKKNIKFWILVCLWGLFILKLFFDVSLNVYLIVNVVIRILYFCFDDYLDNKQSVDS